MKRILYNGYFEDNLQKCIYLLDIVKDPYDLSYDMFWVFISNLKTVGNKQTSIQLLNKKIESLKLQLKNVKDSYLKFSLTELLNDYIVCTTSIYFSLHEIKKGIEFFHNYYVESDKEIKEYVLLNLLDDYNLKDAWCKEYEKNKGNIDFRDSLKKRFNELKG